MGKAKWVHAKFDIYQSVPETCIVKVFTTYGQSAGRPNSGHYIDFHFHMSQWYVNIQN